MAAETSPLLPGSAPKRSALAEMWDTLKFAGPIFIAMVTWVAIETTDTALLGHVGTKYLEAASLSDLWTSASGVMIQGDVLSVFASQAIGAGNPKLAGVWLQVAYFSLALMALPVLGLWACTKWVLLGFHEKHELANDAAYYTWVLMATIPTSIAFGQLSSFFQAQRIMKPEVIVSLVAMLCNAGFGVILVLGKPIPHFHGYGFTACPIVSVATGYIQFALMILIFCTCLRMHEAAWPGWSWSHITRARVIEFLKLYMPAALSLASDFWRFSLIGVLAGHLGDTEVGVFTSSYRILWMCLTLSGAVAAAVGIKIGQALGRGDARYAKYVAMTGISLVSVVLGGLGVLVMILSEDLGRIFSSDPVVLAQFKDIRFPLGATMVLMNMAVFLERIPIAMGRTRAVLVVGIIGSWCGQVPGVLLALHFWRKDLVALYTGVAAGYGIVVLLLFLIVMRSDWETYAREAQARSAAKPVQIKPEVNDNASAVN